MILKLISVIAERVDDPVVEERLTIQLLVNEHNRFVNHGQAFGFLGDAQLGSKRFTPFVLLGSGKLLFNDDGEWSFGTDEDVDILEKEIQRGERFVYREGTDKYIYKILKVDRLMEQS